jgi:hypothetical protein
MPATFAVDGLGVGTARTEFGRWGWAFREQPVPDFGIDAHVEPVADGRPLGRLIALQIKAGPSYFAQAVPGGWQYRGSDPHLRSWLRHSLPVVLLFHNPASSVTYWAHVNPDTVYLSGTRWEMLVPSDQVLGVHAREEFRVLAESAPAASDDPVEQSCAWLPPAAVEIVRQAEEFEPNGASRLAAWLASGRDAPRLTIESVLSAAPSWLPEGLGSFEAALAAYAGEHGHLDLAAEALTRAAGYSQQPAGALLAHAALAAAEAGDAQRARTLISLARNDPGPPLLLATAEAVVGHLGQPGPVPVPDMLAAAGPAERAAEPSCLSFLGTQALRRHEVAAAVRYFEEASSAQPGCTSFMLQLGQALQEQVVTGGSAAEADDLQRIEAAAQSALEQRRRWSGPSSPALAMLIRHQMLAGAFDTAAHLATPVPDGAALDSEACADEVVILGTQAAVALGDRKRAEEFAARASSAHARAVAAALLAEPGLPAGEQADLWRAVLTDQAPMESRLLAWHRLAGLGIWPLPGLDDLHEAGVIDDVHRDILEARAAAGRSDLTGPETASELRLRMRGR